DYIFRWLELKLIRDEHATSASAVSSSKPKPLPKESASLTHSFEIGGHIGNLTVSMYEDGLPGAIHLRMAKEGSTVSGLVDCWSSAVSIALQHGVSLRLICEKLAHTRFEPAGFTGNPEIVVAKSIYDYVARWLELRYLTGVQRPLFSV